MSTLAKVPCTIVTGFLGAGKTTLVRHVLENAGGRRLAVIVNEFGDVGIDGEILKSCGIESCTEDAIVELANGCICCTVADDFVPALKGLLDRPSPPEHIVIETSGLALPKPLVKAFNWPEIASRVTVDGVVAVVDGAAVAAGRFADDPEALPRSVKVIITADGKVDQKLLLGLGVGTEDDIENRRTHHDDEEDHDHDDFDSFVVPLQEVADPAALAARLTALAEEFDVLRVKGFAAVANKPLRLLVQAVGPRVTHQYDRPWAANETREGRLVVIGLKGLDRAAVAHALIG